MARQLQTGSYPGLHSTGKGDLLHSVQRALQVLSLIAAHPQGLSARDISRTLNLNISTCYHILNTLVANDYLERHPHNQMYLLGPQIPFLNNAFVQGLTIQDTLSACEPEVRSKGMTSVSLVGRLRSILFRLTEQTQEPSYLADWQHGEVVLQAITFGVN